MKRFFIKKKGWLLACMMVAVGLFMLVTNFFIIMEKDRIIDVVDGYLRNEISFGKIYYIFPNQIIVRKATLKIPRSSPENFLIHVPTIKLTFSPGDSLSEKRIVFTRARFYEPKISSKKALPFLKEELLNLGIILKRLPRGNMAVSVQKARMDLGQTRRAQRSVEGDLELLMQGDTVGAKGFIRKVNRVKSLMGLRYYKNEKKASPYYYALRGYWKGEDFTIRQFNVISDSLHVNLQGKWGGKQIRLKGYSFIRDSLNIESWAKEIFSDTKLVALTETPYGMEQVSNASSSIRHYLLDIDSQLTVTSEKIDIVHLGFVFDGLPIDLSGNIHLSQEPSFDLSMNVERDIAPRAVSPGVNKISVYLGGAFRKQRFETKSQVKIVFNDKAKESLSLNDINASFNELVTDFSRHPLIRIGFKDAQISAGNDEDLLALQNFSATLDFSKDRQKLVKFHSRLYDGHLKGNVDVRKKQERTQITTEAILKDVDIHRIGNPLLNFSQMEGRLDSEISFRNYPAMDLKADMTVRDGILRDLRILDWISGYFDMPSLTEVDFERFSSKFLLRNQKIDFQEISLKSADVNFDGYFKLGKNKLVSSEFSVMFARDLMLESRPLKPVLVRIQPDVDPLQFDFELSGKLDSVNFQWSSSDLKEEIEQIIPAFIQRKVEKGIEDAI